MTRKAFQGLKFFYLIFGLIVLFSGLNNTVSAQKVRLRAQINPDCVSAGNPNAKFADIYADGNIAVQGSYGCRGAFIYDISNPDAPTLAAHYNPGANQQFLEAIVVGNRGYFGSGNGGGVHIVDLSDPRDPKLLGVVNSSNGNGFNSIHEMMVWDNFLIVNSNNTINKLLKVINISNPANPVFIRDINPSEVYWVHAMHIRGNRMYTSGWGTSSNRARTEIYDITNIATQAPTLLGFIEDPTGVTAGNNMHSSWTSEDGNYLYSCREVSNSNGPYPGDVRVYDVRDPAQPVLVRKISMNDLGLNAVSPHNPVVMGDKLYVAWYQAGLQIFDLKDPANPVRVGQYDTYYPAFAPPEVDEAKSSTVEPWEVICGSDGGQNILPTNYDGNWAVYPFLGTDKVLAGDITNGLLILDVRGLSAPQKNKVSDFDGDGKTDFSVYSPASGQWLVENSSNSSSATVQFGLNGDKVVTGDFDGDGKSDPAIFRPSTGVWWYLSSLNGNQIATNWGISTDVPVPADYDADGKTDFAVFRPSTGVWYIQQSTLGTKILQWGKSGDRAFSGDFEGDGKADLAIWRPSDGTWYILQSSSSQPLIAPFGISTDKPLSGDFDGDGKHDLAVYRPASGYWYILNSKNNSLTILPFGLAEDQPVPADYDGDGKTDIAVFRPSTNVWYLLSSADSGFEARVFGQNGDVPSPTSVQP